MDDLRAEVRSFVDDWPDARTFAINMLQLSQDIGKGEWPEHYIPVLADILERIHKYAAPVMPKRGTNAFELEKERQELTSIRRQFVELGYVKAVLVATTSFLDRVLPTKPQPKSSITASLLSTLPNFPQTVDRIIEPFFYASTIKAEAYAQLRKQLWANICLASGMPIGSSSTPRHIWPEHSKLPRSELFHTYAKDTPLQRLSRLRIPLFAPRNVLHAHTAIFAPPDHGKTQLLQTIVYDLLQDDPPAMFIIDSHGDMLKNLRPIVPRDRLVVIDPVTNPPELNFFDTEGAQADTLFKYLMSSIDREFTAKQESTVIYLLRLMQKIPNPTLWKFVEVLQENAKRIDDSKFAVHIRQLDPVALSYFASTYFTRDEKKTREQIGSRVYSMMSNAYFQKMFSADRNTFKPFEMMESGKIVLINTNADALGEAASVFGRYMIAQIVMAAFRRSSIPESQRKLALLILDEAHTYFDSTTEKILDECRKWKLGCIFATQHIGKMEEALKKSMAQSTTTKIVGPVSVSDARFLAGEMRTVPGLFASMKKEKEYAEFGLYVRNITATTVRVRVPFGLVAEASRNEHAASPPPAVQATTTKSAAGASDADEYINEQIDDDVDHTAPTPWNV